MQKQKIKKHFILQLFTAITVVFLAIINFGYSQSLKISDALYKNSEISNNIIVIAIDDKSISNLEKGTGQDTFSLWPRSLHGQIINIINEDQATSIFFDILFDTIKPHVLKQDINRESIKISLIESNQKKLEAYEQILTNYSNPFADVNDIKFAKELSKHNNIYLGAIFERGTLRTPLQIFNNAANTAIANGSTDKDGVVRKIKLQYKTTEGETLDSFPLAAAKHFLNENDLKVPTDENGMMLLNYYGDPFSYPTISFSDVIAGNFEPGTFKDKIVLIGVTSIAEIHDEYLTPKSNTTLMPGVEIWANAIQTILDQDYLRYQTKTEQILTIITIVAILTALLSYTGITTSILITIAAFILYYLAARFFFNQGVILNMVNPNIAILLTYIGSWITKYINADKTSKELEKAFKHYVSDELVDQITKNPEIVKLGGDKRAVTVFFSDIESSTTISEKVEITDWVKQLNEYFTVMEDILKQSGGTLDKFEGDAIMGFWNAPIPQQNHVLRGYIAALTMQKGLRDLQQKWAQQGKPAFNIRIGVNSGEAIVGNFGSKNHLNYTVMGDPVNTASRLESAANKAYGIHLCVANFQKFASQEDISKLVLRELDTVILPGKTKPTKIHQLLCLTQELTETTKKLLQDYAIGLSAYRAKNWPEAKKHFQKHPEDTPSQIMLKRCEALEKGQKITGLQTENMVFKIQSK